MVKAPVDGFYELGASCLTSAPASAGGVELYVYKNGAYVTLLAEVNQSGNTFFPMIPGGSTVLEMEAGDEVTIYVAGNSMSLDTANDNSNFYIFRVN